MPAAGSLPSAPRSMSATGSIRSSLRPAFDELFAAANTAQYPEQYRYMAFRLAHSEGRTLAPVIYRDGGPETADLYARFSDFLAGKSS